MINLLNNKKKTCLVTGCAGFVGSHLAHALLDLGHPVIGVDNLFSGVHENMAGFSKHPQFTFCERSTTERNLLFNLKADHPDLDHVFHLAAIVSVPYSMAHPEETMQVNCVSSIDLYEQATSLELASFVFAGSAAEYGFVSVLPLKEGDAIQAERDVGLFALHASPYGRSKYMASRYIEGNNFGSSLRFFNIYGPRQLPSSPYSGVISKFVGQALSGTPLTVEGDGKQTRDFIYICDAVRAYIMAAGLHDADATPVAGIFNIGLESQTTILELASLILGACEREKVLCFLPTRQGDIRYSQASISKFWQKTGFKAAIGLPEGVKQTLEWAKKNRELYPDETFVPVQTCPGISA